MGVQERDGRERGKEGRREGGKSEEFRVKSFGIKASQAHFNAGCMRLYCG